MQRVSENQYIHEICIQFPYNGEEYGGAITLDDNGYYDFNEVLNLKFVSIDEVFKFFDAIEKMKKGLEKYRR